VSPLFFPEKTDDIYSVITVFQFCSCFTPIYFLRKNWRPFLLITAVTFIGFTRVSPLEGVTAYKVSPRTFFTCSTSFLQFFVNSPAVVLLRVSPLWRVSPGRFPYSDATGFAQNATNSFFWNFSEYMWLCILEKLYAILFGLSLHMLLKNRQGYHFWGYSVVLAKVRSQRKETRELYVQNSVNLITATSSTLAVADRITAHWISQAWGRRKGDASPKLHCVLK